MANPKIDSIKLPGNTTKYDFDLPTTATPSIASMIIGSMTSSGNTNLSVFGKEEVVGQISVTQTPGEQTSRIAIGYER